MARGPSKGQGGRPRTGQTTGASGGYMRKTVGPKSKGTQVYAHRAAVGKTTRAKGSKATPDVVHHKDGNRKNNAKANLSVKSRSKHVGEHNKKRKRKS
jgi:hypothetical protein